MQRLKSEKKKKPPLFTLPHTANAQLWPKSHFVSQCIRNPQLECPLDICHWPF